MCSAHPPATRARCWCPTVPNVPRGCTCTTIRVHRAAHPSTTSRLSVGSVLPVWLPVKHACHPPSASPACLAGTTTPRNAFSHVRLMSLLRIAQTGYAPTAPSNALRARWCLRTAPAALPTWLCRTAIVYRSAPTISTSTTVHAYPAARTGVLRVPSTQLAA